MWINKWSNERAKILQRAFQSYSNASMHMVQTLLGKRLHSCNVGKDINEFITICMAASRVGKLKIATTTLIYLHENANDQQRTRKKNALNQVWSSLAFVIFFRYFMHKLATIKHICRENENIKRSLWLQWARWHEYTRVVNMHQFIGMHESAKWPK